jgi:hypothetical protein
MKLSNKNKKYLLVASATAIVAIVFLYFYILQKDFSSGQKPIFGVTFSQKYARELGLDWQKTYLAILQDLKVSHIRLIAYWDEIENIKGQYDFSDLSWQVNQAQANQASIILTVGRRTPRWPECHQPDWVLSLTQPEADQKQLEFVAQTINHYKDNQAIIVWQIENEPMLSIFGECPKPNFDFLRQEVDLVKSLDKRPVIITDSGELGNWQKAASVADILGTTLYRIVWNEKLGFWDYWFMPAAFYHYKAELTKHFNPAIKAVIITELQMEPWTLGKPMTEMSLSEQEKTFDLKRFQSNIIYAQKTGFGQAYLWGVEYWFWAKEKGYPTLWLEAKKLWP